MMGSLTIGFVTAAQNAYADEGCIPFENLHPSIQQTMVNIGIQQDKSGNKIYHEIIPESIRILEIQLLVKIQNPQDIFNWILEEYKAYGNQWDSEKWCKYIEAKFFSIHMERLEENVFEVKKYIDTLKDTFSALSFHQTEEKFNSIKSRIFFEALLEELNKNIAMGKEFVDIPKPMNVNNTINARDVSLITDDYREAILEGLLLD
jgi:hypothetical protein